MTGRTMQTRQRVAEPFSGAPQRPGTFSLVVPLQLDAPAQMAEPTEPSHGRAQGGCAPSTRASFPSSCKPGRTLSKPALARYSEHTLIILIQYMMACYSKHTLLLIMVDDDL